MTDKKNDPDYHKNEWEKARAKIIALAKYKVGDKVQTPLGVGIIQGILPEPAWADIPGIRYVISREFAEYEIKLIE